MNGSEHGAGARQRPLRSGQRGVVLIFTLIILLILTIGAIALMRSMNTSLFGAGNLAFRRDLVNQGELAVANVIAEFKTGDLSTPASTLQNVPADNYSATMLPTNAEGVPNVLLAQTLPGAVGTMADLTVNGYPDVTIRYVIDRLCSATGTPTGALCVQSSAAPTGGTAGNKAPVKPPTATAYRLSVRVTGARSTQIFLQTTFTRPD